MPFNAQQRDALKAKLRFRHVKTRENNGLTLAYIEGWHAIAEANRIFGFDSWDRKTMFPRCLWRETQRGQTVCFYTTKVRITVRADGSEILREGIGTGFGRAHSSELAHEIALKAAETDATKRALATFGNAFGLALYDKYQTQVTKPSIRSDFGGETGAASQPSSGSPPTTNPEPADATVLRLRAAGAEVGSFADPDAFVAATLRAVTALPSLDAFYDFWEQNLESFRTLRRGAERNGDEAFATILAALKAKARSFDQGEPKASAASAASQPPQARGSDAPAPLAIAKEKRVRDKVHLAFVASQPCLVCGRAPAQAHHLKFAQTRAMSLKVSDEFTLPLCNVHHDQLHRSGDERAWWARHGIINPLKLAARLWAASRGHVLPDNGVELQGGEGAPTVSHLPGPLPELTDRGGGMSLGPGQGPDAAPPA